MNTKKISLNDLKMLCKRGKIPGNAVNGLKLVENGEQIAQTHY